MESIQNDGWYLTVVPTKAPHAGQAMWVVGTGNPGCGHGSFCEVSGVPNGFPRDAGCWFTARNTSALFGSPNPNARPLGADDRPNIVPLVLNKSPGCPALLSAKLPPKAGALNTEGWSTFMSEFPNTPPLALGAEVFPKGAPKGPLDFTPNAGAVYVEGWAGMVLLLLQGCLVLLQ